MKGRMFTTPNEVNQSLSLIHSNDGWDPTIVNPMLSVLANDVVGYYKK